MARVIYQGEVVHDDGAKRGLDRPPQLGDTVEYDVTKDRGTVERVKLGEGLGHETDPTTFYVRWRDGFAGWYIAAELVVLGGAPASDPSAYVDEKGASQ